LVTKYNMYVR